MRAMPIRWQNAGSDAKSLICRVSSAVEQRFCKPQVVGSIPTPGTNLIKHLAGILWMIVVRSSSLGNILGNILSVVHCRTDGVEDAVSRVSLRSGVDYASGAKNAHTER